MVYSKNLSQIGKNSILFEDEIIKKNSNVTILNSTMIYGNSRDINMSRLIRFMDRYRFFPIFGNGENYMQPIYIEDLSRVFYFDVIKSKINTFNKKYIVALKDAN